MIQSFSENKKETILMGLSKISGLGDIYFPEINAYTFAKSKYFVLQENVTDILYINTKCALSIFFFFLYFVCCDELNSLKILELQPLKLDIYVP